MLSEIKEKGLCTHVYSNISLYSGLKKISVSFPTGPVYRLTESTSGFEIVTRLQQAVGIVTDNLRLFNFPLQCTQKNRKHFYKR